MKITVSREDIDRGRRLDPDNCAVAVALRRSGLAHAGVTGLLVWVEGGRICALLPEVAQHWIADFDCGLPVTPFEFDLMLPQTEQSITARTEVEATSACNRVGSKLAPLLPARKPELTVVPQRSRWDGEAVEQDSFPRTTAEPVFCK